MNYEEYTVRIYDDGTKIYCQNGRLHRMNGPAIEWADGDKFYYQHGKFHRDDGPAIEYSEGTKKYYQKGRLHRMDGPAIEWSDGAKSYFIKGKEFTEEEFLNGRGLINDLRDVQYGNLKKEQISCHGKTVEIDGKKYKLTLED